MYAHDTLLISKADNINEVIRKAQKALQSLAKFAFETEQNPEKCWTYCIKRPLIF